MWFKSKTTTTCNNVLPSSAVNMGSSIMHYIIIIYIYINDHHKCQVEIPGILFWSFEALSWHPLRLILLEAQMSSQQKVSEANRKVSEASAKNVLSWCLLRDLFDIDLAPSWHFQCWWGCFLCLTGNPRDKSSHLHEVAIRCCHSSKGWHWKD